MRTQSKSIKDLINGLRNTHDRVVVFTQSQELIWDYLLSSTGRYNVSYNPKYWDVKIDKKIISGRLVPGFKIGLNTGAGGDVGLDCPGTDLVFTCNPFYPLLPTDGVFKDPFSFTTITPALGFKPLDIINREKSLAIKLSSFNDLIRLHDYMVVNSIEHSVETEDEGNTHLIRSASRVNPSKMVFIDGPFLVEELLSFARNKEILFNHEIEFHYPDFTIVRELLRVFDEFPESGLTAEFLSFRLSVSPITIAKILEFLLLAGCLKKAYQNNDHITIHKGYVDNPDKLFKLIPEGTYSIKALLKQLKLPRISLLKALKHYEGKGINFAYVPKLTEDIYIYMKPLKNEEYNKACAAIHLQLSFMSDWVSRGDRFLNEWLERKIEKHCLETNSKAVLFAVGQATHLNFNPSVPME